MKRRAQPIEDPNPIADQATSPAMADGAIAGDVVRPQSIPELLALLTVLRERGYEMKQRTEWERNANQWLFIVVPIMQAPAGSVSAEAGATE